MVRYHISRLRSEIPSENAEVYQGQKSYLHF